MRIRAARLVGAVEASGHAALGKDAGEVAGIGPIGVLISTDYDALVTADTVTLDFTIPAAALAHLRTAVAKQAAIVIGTTGFSAEQRAEAESYSAPNPFRHCAEYEHWRERPAQSCC